MEHLRAYTDFRNYGATNAVLLAKPHPLQVRREGLINPCIRVMQIKFIKILKEYRGKPELTIIVTIALLSYM